jgi:RHS repeat-associated protein
LNWRQNNKYSGLKEDFQYDNLDRLDDVYKGGTMTLDMAYDGNKGGITTKTDVGTLLYNTSGKQYAVSSISPITGLTPSAAQTITYTSFEKVNTISENGYLATIKYNSDNGRAKMDVLQNSVSILTRWYPSGDYIKETSGGVTKEYTFIGGDAYSAPVVAITQSGTTTYYDLLRDYLGSITHVVNTTTNAVVAEYSFDAWGRMRNPSTWVNYTPGSEPALFVAGRGYTGHEHLPWFNLINMNGRVYDPLIAMFLSPDNYVQNPGSTQSYNRYGYCLNNPLKYSDPSGMLVKMRDENDALAEAYFTRIFDVAGAWHYNDMAGGSGGHSYHYGTMGSGYYDTGHPTYNTSDVLGSLWNATPVDGKFHTYTNINGDWYHTSRSTITYNNTISLYGLTTSLYEGGMPAVPGGKQKIIFDKLKYAIPVAITWAAVGSAEGVMAGQVTPVGYGIILRGPNRFQSIGFSSAGAGAGWVGADGSIATTYYFYTGDINNFNRFSLGDQAWDLSFSCGEGWSAGINIAFAQDRYGAYIIGIGPSVGVGASPTFFTGQYSMTLTKIWK